MSSVSAYRVGKLALLAAMGMFATNTTPAAAADLGGNCCADLEERIAELEATTARKGNRKVSLTISGHVNEAVTWWDDGFESNVYVGTNDVSQSRFRFLGDAKITGDWSAGYLLELGVNGAKMDRVNQEDDNGSPANAVSVRHSAWYLASKSLGKLWVGQTSQAMDGITEINLANTNHFAYSGAWGDTFGDGGGGFHLRRADGALLTGLQWGDFVAQGSSESFPGEGGRFNVVKYESPAFGGFSFSSSWGEDDLWDIALRYKGEFSGFKLAAGIGYGEVTDQNAGAGRRGLGDTEELGLSGSIMHVATGLYASGAWGTLEDDGVPAGFDNETDAWTIQAGIEQKFFPIGKTTIFGEFFQLDRGFGASLTGPLNGASLGTGNATITNSEITGWSVGLNQNLNEVIDLYLIYRHVELDVTTANGVDADLEDMQFLTAGGYIKF